MSRDIQLFNNPNLPALAEDPFQTNALGQAMSQQPSPIRKVQRLLRGRMLLAVVLGLLCGLLGAAYGYTSQKPRFSSDGIVWIKPVIPAIASNEKTIPFYDRFVQSQVNIIPSGRVLDQAVQSADWKATGMGSDPSVVAEIKMGLDVEYMKGTQHIHVSYADESGPAAQAVVRSVIRAYHALYPAINGEDLTTQLNQLKEKQDDLTTQMRAYQAQIDAITEKHGSNDLSAQWQMMQRSLSELEERMSRMDMTLETARQGPANGAQPNNPELSVEDIAKVDATMRVFVKAASELKVRVDNLSHIYGERSPVLQQAKQELDSNMQRIDSYAESFRNQFKDSARIIRPDQFESELVTKEQLADLRRVSAQYHERFNALSAKSVELGKDNAAIFKLTDKIRQNQQDLDKFGKQYEEKLSEAAFGGTLAIVEEADTPIRAADSRLKFAFLGFVGGAGVPIGLLLLIGLLDGRYRYSEEPTADMGGLALLGILPNLPDRLTDPAQAATAAHCVHQIRTMLQINSSEDRKIYAITSASPGDGKTSLTLALGLSFAASGSRTLLIDCDLVGAGLTARLDMNGPDGVIEAMARKTLLPYVRTTDVAELAMLPVGTAQAHHAGMFSPSALRRILDEARQHFDIVLIDSGPILGSIEATPACAAADGVVLTVSRGQQRPMVERAMQHLQSIGARFAGVVFNRAQAKDFARSVSGISLRSIARQHDSLHGRSSNGHPNGNGNFRKASVPASDKAFGPVARAVASSVKPPDSGPQKK